jgi:signal transduction histidine kinase
MKRFSLKRRLVGAVVLSQVLLALALVVVASWYARYYLRSAFDVNLEGRALSVAALVYYPDDHSPGLLFDSSKLPPSSHHTHKDMYLVRSDHGDFEERSKNSPQDFLEQIPPDAHYWNFEDDGEPYRAIILRDVPILDTEPGEPKPLPRLTVIYAAPTMDIRQRITALAVAIGISSAILVLPTILLAIFNIRRTLIPLNELAEQAKKISVQNWEFKPPEEAKAAVELEPLIGAIEAVLAGLERAFTRQREFLGDAAHELKTSLAILKSTLQAVMNRPRDPHEYREGLDQISEDSERLEQLLNRMLRLARVEQWAADGIHRELEVVDIASTCEMAIARIASFAAERDVRIEFLSSEMVVMRADAGDLELVWLNLLENAVKYSAPGSKVTVALEYGKDVAIVSVSDTGMGIPEPELTQIFERFQRGDPSRSRATGGFGLGLAIAKSLVQAYKGSIYAESKIAVGTRIIVQLPTLPAGSFAKVESSATNLDAPLSRG